MSCTGEFTRAWRDNAGASERVYGWFDTLAKIEESLSASR